MKPKLSTAMALRMSLCDTLIFSALKVPLWVAVVLVLLVVMAMEEMENNIVLEQVLMNGTLVAVAVELEVRKMGVVV